jgi:hypothetical protein
MPNDKKYSAQLRGRAKGGRIPSPKQMTPEQARSMSIKKRMTNNRPTMDDIPELTPQEMQEYNRPAMDINDAFFGPDRKRFDVVEFLTALMGGGK